MTRRVAGDALPKELAEMYEADQLKIEKSATCSRSWRLCFDTFDLTNELTKEYIARDEAEEEAVAAEERAAKRVKRHCGDEGDF